MSVGNGKGGKKQEKVYGAAITVIHEYLSEASVCLTTRVLIIAVGSTAGSNSGAPCVETQTDSPGCALAWLQSVPLRKSGMKP